MRIDEKECVGCRQCLVYCPMGAISMDEEAEAAMIDEDECVECGVCFRSRVCPVDAFEEELHSWPRSIRAAFSNPLLVQLLYFNIYKYSTVSSSAYLFFTLIINILIYLSILLIMLGIIFTLTYLRQ